MSAIKDVLSRKLFSQGGLLEPEQGRNTGGILASSQPLMEAAKFVNGGSAMVPEFQGQDAIQLQDVPFMETYFPSVQAEQARRKNAAFEGRSQLDQFLGSANPEVMAENQRADLYGDFYQSPPTKTYIERKYESLTDPNRRTVDQISASQIVSSVAGEMVKIRPDLKDLIEQGAQEYAIQVGTGNTDGASVPEAENFITNYIAKSNETDRSTQERLELLQRADGKQPIPVDSKTNKSSELYGPDPAITGETARRMGLDAEKNRARLKAEEEAAEIQRGKDFTNNLLGNAKRQDILRRADEAPEATVMTGLTPETTRSPDRIDQIRPEVLGPEEFRKSIGEGAYMRQDGVSKKILEAVEVIESKEGPGKTKEENKKLLKSKLDEYTQEFKNAVGNFEGKTNYEKGMDFVELGMSIAAGKDTNTITNVANGIKENLGRFTEDDKAKRAYKKQVDLSAAKYGLENLKVDEANVEKLKAEERALYKNLFVVTPGESITYNGRQYSEGSTIVPSVGDLRDGTFPLNRVTSEAFSLESLKLQKAKLKSDLDFIKGLTVSPAKFEGGMTKYIDAASQVKGNIAIQDLITDSRELLIAGNVTGGKQAAAALLQKAENFFGINIPGASEDPAKYRSQIAAAITANITALLNEGNRTISDADRKRAEDIGGLWADTITGGATQNIEIVSAQLDRFEQSLERNSLNSISLMNGLEKTWSGSLSPARKDYGVILKEARGELSASASAKPTEYSWQDIIQQGSDGTLTLKPNWRAKE